MSTIFKWVTFYLCLFYNRQIFASYFIIFSNKFWKTQKITIGRTSLIVKLSPWNDKSLDLKNSVIPRNLYKIAFHISASHSISFKEYNQHHNLIEIVLKFSILKINLYELSYFHDKVIWYSFFHGALRGQTLSLLAYILINWLVDVFEMS